MKLKYCLPTLVLLGSVVLSGCYKDDSTEGLTAVNQITLSDERTKELISIYQGETLSLSPQITQSLVEGEDNLEYEWLAYDNTSGGSYIQPDTILSRERNLNFVVTDPPFTLGQSYRVRFAATDKNTGLTEYLAYDITIANQFGEGWLLLEDKNGVGDLSMILPNGEVVHNIYSERNSEPLIGPRKLELTTMSVTDDMSAYGKRLYIIAETGSQEYNYLTMVKKFDFNYLFFSAPPVENPQRMTWVSSSTGATLYPSMGVAINDGKAHYNLVGGFPGVKRWMDILLNPDGTLNYYLAPFIAGGTTYSAVLYDNVGKRFYSIGTNSLDAFPPAASTVFDMNDVGMEMVFQDSANIAREWNAIMKDDTGQPYLLRYKTAATAEAPEITLSKTLMNAPNVLSLTAAAGATMTPHIYYGVDNTLTRYETTSNTSSTAWSFVGGEQITAIEYRRGSTPALLVGTWNGAQGKLYVFSVNSVGDLQLSQAYEGFNKIVDMAYKIP